MTRKTDYRDRQILQRYTVEQMVCNGGGCGVVEDVEPTKRNEGWISVQRQIDGRPLARDFCSWSCFHGWVMAEGEEDGTVLQEWTRATERLREERIDQLGARPDIEREFAAVMNGGEQAREE